ncbi:MAG: hypothetical protein LBP61_03105 [Desulfovibrio sp.]|jgi:hypothetical protein|nr:hypothetical protein [Desulfovibrio sp.]
MGRNLFIRVSAATYDEDRMRAEWPCLCALAWPEESGGKDPALWRSAGGANLGIMDLAEVLPDRVVYGVLSGRTEGALPPLVRRLRECFLSLENALGDRDVALAGTLTNSLEEALDALEASLALRGTP